MLTDPTFFDRVLQTLGGSLAERLGTWRRASIQACTAVAETRDTLARKLYLTVSHEQVKVSENLGSGIDKAGFKARCEIDLPGTPRGNPVCYKAANRVEDGGRPESCFLGSCLWNDQIWGELVIWSLVRLGHCRGRFAGVLALVERNGQIVGYLCEFCTSLDYGERGEVDGGGEWHGCDHCAGAGEHERTEQPSDEGEAKEWTLCAHCDGDGEVRCSVPGGEGETKAEYDDLMTALEPIGIGDQHSSNVGYLRGEMVTLDYGLGSCWNLEQLTGLTADLAAKIKNSPVVPTTPREVIALTGNIYKNLFE